jgi:hypothetical protein
MSRYFLSEHVCKVFFLLNLLCIQYACAMPQDTWSHWLFENATTAFGNICKEHRPYSYLPAVLRTNVCTFMLYGATWDGHFKHFAKSGRLVRTVNGLRALLESSPQEYEIECSYMFYHAHYDSAVRAPQQMPQDIPCAWSPDQTDVGSYAFRIFRNGTALRDQTVEDALRRGDVAAPQQLIDLCASDTSVHQASNMAWMAGWKRRQLVVERHQQINFYFTQMFGPFV